jgi:hypothetical protein
VTIAIEGARAALSEHLPEASELRGAGPVTQARSAASLCLEPLSDPPALARSAFRSPPLDTRALGSFGPVAARARELAGRVPPELGGVVRDGAVAIAAMAEALHALHSLARDAESAARCRPVRA